MSEVAVLSISFSIAIGCVILIFNFFNIGDVKWFYKVNKELRRGDYKYHTKLMDQIVFRRIDDREEIIFFGDGSIKVISDVYIHKSMLWMSVFNMYYYWQFHKSKEFYVNQHKAMEEYRRINLQREGRQYDVYVKKHNTTFKFFRG
jgi:hypothetical protein